MVRKINYNIKVKLTNDMKAYKAGNVKNYYDDWRKLTSDIYILTIIKNGLRLEFSHMPKQKSFNPCTLSEKEKTCLDIEIDKLLSKKVIRHTKHERGKLLHDLSRS